MVAAVQSVATPILSETTDSTTEEEGLKDEEEEWQEVGPKNKLTIKRQVSILIYYQLVGVVIAVWEAIFSTFVVGVVYQWNTKQQ